MYPHTKNKEILIINIIYPITTLRGKRGGQNGPIPVMTKCM